MKYKVTLNNRIYEVEVEEGKAMLVDEYEAVAPIAELNPSALPASPAQTAAGAAAGGAAAGGAGAGAGGAAAPAAGVSLAAGEVVKSPMPGNILKINVSQGQQVKEGDVLLILEAMKMENEVVAPKDGTVAQIVVGRGSVVETGSALVVIA